MKFNNGCWIFKEGTECFSPAEVYFSKVENDEVTICAPTHHINHRGDTLGGVNLTIKISAPMPEVIRVQTFHYMGVQKREPSFQIEVDENSVMEVKEDEWNLEVTSGLLRLVINKKWWSMTYYRGDELLTSSNGKDLGYIKTDWRGLAYDDGGLHDTYMRQSLSLGVGELVYGTGERLHHL